MIVQAEQYRVIVNMTPGEHANAIDNTNAHLKDPELLPTSFLPDIDDEFSHIAYHIDETLHGKIERGEYVDLEKLLPKSRHNGNDDKMDLVFHDGYSYFVPAQNDNKINGV